MTLQTDWVRIGRSGASIDGRVIEEQWLLEAAETYDAEFFEAPIWPGHTDYYRLGGVTGLRAEANDEGGTDLYARLDPNSYYRYSVENGQLLHTSMELTPNFRESGKWYLEGLAATDKPASVATTKIEFSKLKSLGEGVVFSDFMESAPHTFEVKKPKNKSIFKQFFKQSKPIEDDMDKKLLLELQEKMSGFEAFITKFSAFIEADEDKDKTPDEPSTNYESETTAKIEKLTQEFDALKEKLNSEEIPTKEEFSAFVAELKTVKDTLAVALSSADGTPTPEHDGDSVNNDNLY